MDNLPIDLPIDLPGAAHRPRLGDDQQLRRGEPVSSTPAPGYGDPR